MNKLRSKSKHSYTSTTYVGAMICWTHPVHKLFINFCYSSFIFPSLVHDWSVPVFLLATKSEFTYYQYYRQYRYIYPPRVWDAWVLAYRCPRSHLIATFALMAECTIVLILINWITLRLFDDRTLRIHHIYISLKQHWKKQLLISST